MGGVLEAQTYRVQNQTVREPQCPKCFVILNLCADLEYILSNVIDPSAEVGRDYRLSVVRTLDDRVITGIVVERTAARVVVQTATDRVTLSADDVGSVKDSPLSIMPEGQLDPLTKEQVRDLVGYLASKTQVAQPK